MGIRPSFYLVLGLNDLQTNMAEYEIIDPRYKHPKEGDRQFHAWQEGQFESPAYDPYVKFENLTPDQFADHMDAISIHHWLKENTTPGITGLNGDAFIWSPEYGLPNVIGVVLNEIFDEMVLWALVALYPEFGESGFKEIPSLSLAEDESSAAYVLRVIERARKKNPDFDFDSLAETPTSRSALAEARRKERLIEHGHNYPFFQLELESWFAITEWVFKACGFTVERRELRLMLYWKWG